ncbi:uncharacterized protein LOC144145041 [Haemaphysalis longicornis]
MASFSGRVAAILVSSGVWISLCCVYDDCANDTKTCLENIPLDTDSVTCAFNLSLDGQLDCPAPPAMCANVSLKRILYVHLWLKGSKKFQGSCAFRPVFYQWMLPCWMKLRPPRDDRPYLLRG